MQKLIVASNSARRQQLMKDAGFQFDVHVLDVDESLEEGVASLEVAEFLAEKKNKAYRALFKDEVVLTSDTVVISKGQILGKPKDEKEAFKMITSLVGYSHEVVSGVCISSPDHKVSFSEVTTVQMRGLSPEEIRYYIKNYQPYDKAGSYGIQEWIGMVGIDSIQGSFYNVMGLPIHRVYQMLKSDFGIYPV
ncbi:Maf family protein [Reichenbachiella carrageenanivorans]|uniref:dTTP/UTP pyrophosphatase n=1 Tax=Reichenbachiella carrageenanivorans TaxID=2979869 RepID=A0ABY6D4Q1_9BACT|nr:Maf family protein [Reichenbachiella carrageenanivorans]UXX78830.1 Maf family protein [Reichenbachiella carrageenanivorans]